jgi:hypothetical protein
VFTVIEGVRVAGNVVGVEHDELKCELPVQVTFADGLPLWTLEPQ